MEDTHPVVEFLHGMGLVERMGSVGGFGTLLCRHAVVMDKVRDMPKGERRGRRGYCYNNAANLLIKYPGVAYCEGYAISNNGLSIPLMHGWVVDIETLEVIDPTWKHGSHHVGIPFTREFVYQCMRNTGELGILGSQCQKGWDIASAMCRGEMPAGQWLHPVAERLVRVGEPSEIEVNLNT